MLPDSKITNKTNCNLQNQIFVLFSFHIYHILALPGLLHGSLSGIKTWSPWSSRMCLCVPFFIDLRNLLAPALKQVYLPLGTHLLFPGQLLLILSSFRHWCMWLLIWCLHFEISDMLFFPRRGRSSNYHIITKGKAQHQSASDTIVRTTAAQGWLPLCRPLLCRARQAVQSMLKGGGRGRAQPLPSTA